MPICKYCGSEIKKGAYWIHYKTCDAYKEWIEDFEKNKIPECISLFNSGYSFLELSNKYDISYNTLEKLMAKYGIHRKTCKEQNNNPRVREKYKQTCLNHFGAEHNFSKNSASRKKWEAKLHEDEGIVNVFQRDSVKQKIKSTELLRYGETGRIYNRTKGSTLKYWIEKLGEEDGVLRYQEICYNKGKSNRLQYWIEKYGKVEGEKKYRIHIEQQCKKTLVKGFFTGLNHRVKQILISNNIAYEEEYPILYEGNKHFFYDFKIGNIILELNGDYWHCNPSMYKESDIVQYPGNNYKLVKDIWERDKKKKEVAILNNFDFVVLWENELKSMSDEELLNFINSFII